MQSFRHFVFGGGGKGVHWLKGGMCVCVVWAGVVAYCDNVKILSRMRLQSW